MKTPGDCAALAGDSPAAQLAREGLVIQERVLGEQPLTALHEYLSRRDEQNRFTEHQTVRLLKRAKSGVPVKGIYPGLVSTDRCLSG